MDDTQDFCSYFCHHNWRWVVEKAVEMMKATDNLNNLTVTACSRTNALPSFVLLQRVLKRYSLFRVEIYSHKHLACAWVSACDDA